MTTPRRPRSLKTERTADQRRTRRARQQHAQLRDRYAARPVYPDPEPRGVYRP